MDNYIVTDWVKLDDTGIFNQIPFGVYALTEPTDKLPPKSIMPHEYDRTIYFGRSGISYNDFFHDRKNVEIFNAIGDKLVERERFYRYTHPVRRLKVHRHNLVKKNHNLEREVSYTKFYESFGYGKEIASKVNVCMILPATEIPNHSVKAWLAAIESYMILRYQYNFGKNTLMNIDHSLDHTSRINEDSHAQRRKNDTNQNLRNFFQNA